LAYAREGWPDLVRTVPAPLGVRAANTAEVGINNNFDWGNQNDIKKQQE